MNPGAAPGVQFADDCGAVEAVGAKSGQHRVNKRGLRTGNIVSNSRTDTTQRCYCSCTWTTFGQTETLSEAESRPTFELHRSCTSRTFRICTKRQRLEDRKFTSPFPHCSGAGVGAGIQDGQDSDQHCSDDDLRVLQQQLFERPDAGDLIRGAKGLRKLRWALPGRGKSGGARVIYYWRTGAGPIFLLYAFPKNAQADLNAAQSKMLVQWVNEVLDDE